MGDLLHENAFVMIQFYFIMEVLCIF